MPWTKEQCERLAVEKKLLERKFPGAQIIAPKENTSIQLESKTASGIDYTLMSPIPGNFPNSMMPLYVTKPNPLVSYDRRSAINSLKSSHNFHTHENKLYGGCVEICYTNHWHPGMTIVKVLSSGIIWMQCYQIHLQTGKTIHNILEEYKNKLDDFFTQS